MGSFNSSMYQALGGRLTAEINPLGKQTGISTYRGGNYCGPAWGFTKADVGGGLMCADVPAINEIDAACRRHDICYGKHGYLTRHCNTALASDLLKVAIAPGSKPGERIDAYVMFMVFGLESVTVDFAIEKQHEVKAKIRKYWAETNQKASAVMWQLEREIVRCLRTGHW